MKKKILAILSAIVVLLSVVAPMSVCATEPEEEKQMVEVEDQGVQLTVKLSELKMNEKNKTDNIRITIKNTKTKERVNLEFTEAKNWTDVKIVEPGIYKIDDKNGTADNKMRVLIKQGSIEVPKGKAAVVELKVEKIQNNSFFAKFFRDNSIILILLAICTIAYLVFRQRRLNGVPQRNITF